MICYSTVTHLTTMCRTEFQCAAAGAGAVLTRARVEDGAERGLCGISRPSRKLCGGDDGRGNEVASEALM